jgi:hydrogenase/urease accessory protein HupE
MNSTRAARALLALATAAAGTALAHPGHGTAEATFSWIHFFTEPDHLLALLALVIGVAVLVRSGARR